MPALAHMTWREVLALHWRVEPEWLQGLPNPPPPELETDRFDGSAWLSVVAFEMAGVRGPLGLRLPGHTRFPELNLRTYVTGPHGPGVWFHSLDAGNPLMARLLRRVSGMAYRPAEMEVEEAEAGSVRYRSRHPHLDFEAEWRRCGPARTAEAGSVEEFLMERYVAYARPSHRLRAWRVDHAPWPLHAVEGAWSVEPVGRQPDLVVGSAGVDVRAGPAGRGSPRHAPQPT